MENKAYKFAIFQYLEDLILFINQDKILFTSFSYDGSGRFALIYRADKSYITTRSGMKGDVWFN